MSLSPEIVNRITNDGESEGWSLIAEETLRICSDQIQKDTAVNTVIGRERNIGELDSLLSSCAWELWHAFPSCVESNSGKLINWYKTRTRGRAILILDGLSAREIPWLIQGARERGYQLNSVGLTAAELPPETQFFAKALGFSNRSSLANNGAGMSHFFPLAKTECVNLPWKDCASLIDASPNWVFWHQWPDSFLHRESEQGLGLETLTKECATVFSSNDFWAFIERLAQGRELVITSDHGYAASGYFTDAGEEASVFLKAQLRSGRSVPGAGAIGPFVPPVMMQYENYHGVNRLALGRWKWKSPGGYPTLTHGGMSLFEVLCPWVELWK